MRRLSTVLTFAMILAAPLAASAQGQTGAINLQIPPNVRGEGMGGAWAVLDTGPMGAWGNVGALGLHRGAAASRMRAQLAPDFSGDVDFRYHSLVAGMDIPQTDLHISVGYTHTHLDYGELSVVGLDGKILRTYTPYETTQSLSLSLGLHDLLGLGVAFKNSDIVLGPQAGGRASGSLFDYGLYVRSPWGRFGPAVNGGAPMFSLRPVGGISWQNEGSGISFGANGSDPPPYTRRWGLGVEVEAFALDDLADSQNPWVRRLLKHSAAVSIRGSVSESQSLIYRTALNSRGDLPESVSHEGMEVNFYGLLAIRWGHVDDPNGRVGGTTLGWGTSLFGYVSYDFSRTPQAGGLRTIEKHAVSVSLPLE